MNQQTSNDPTPVNPGWHIGRFLAAAVGFGVLMGLSESGPNIWVRVPLAGAAFAWLAWTVLSPKRRRSGSCC